MKRNIFILFFVTIFGTCCLNAQEIEWLDFGELEKAMSAEPKFVLLDFYTDWCGWCKRMDATTFKDEKLVAFINENFYAVKFNAEQKEDVFFQNTNFKFVPSGRRGYHELASGFLQGRLSYPTLVILNEKYEIFQAFPGYRTAEELLPILTFLGEKHFLNTDWTTFMKDWESN